MAIKDVLLALTSYPEPSFGIIIDKAIDFAAAIDAKLSAIACEVRVAMPGSPLGDAMFDVHALANAEAQKSRASAEKLLATFEQRRPRAACFASGFSTAVLRINWPACSSTTRSCAT